MPPDRKRFSVTPLRTWQRKWLFLAGNWPGIALQATSSITVHQWDCGSGVGASRRNHCHHLAECRRCMIGPSDQRSPSEILDRPTPENRAYCAMFLKPETTKWPYFHGSRMKLLFRPKPSLAPPFLASETTKFSLTCFLTRPGNVANSIRKFRSISGRSRLRC